MPTSEGRVRWQTWAGGAVIAAAALLAYRHSFSGPLVFDDLPAILNNRSIEHWRGALTPPSGATVSGRPLLNLSFALNYAISAREVWSYHAVNLAIHLLAGLTLFGILSRTLVRCGSRAASATGTPAGVTEAARLPSVDATLPAFLSALLWTVHPLQTESVTYVVQRAESLMGLFYLLTLYGFIRSVEGDGETEARRPPLRSGGRLASVSTAWAALSLLACLCGMATKEVMVSAPVLVLLYDRTFVSGAFRSALHRRRAYYASLAATWLVLASFAFANGNRGGTSGFNVGVPWWSYAQTQFPAVVHYLRLSVWPHPLVFDYGTQWVTSFGQILPSATIVIGLVAATGWALQRQNPRGIQALGFAGAFFFAILAPTSLIPGTRQTMAEHRMYLALAPVLAVVVTAVFRLGGGSRQAFVRANLARVCLVFGLMAAAGLAYATDRRNETYRSDRALWGDTTAKVPGNFYAQNNLGDTFLRAGRTAEAIACYERALQFQANFPEAQNNLAVALGLVGRQAEAIPHFEQAVRLKPDFVAAQTNLGGALVSLGRVPEAIAHFEAAWRIEPQAIEANNLADALALAGRLPEALGHYQDAVRLDPGFAEAHDHLGVALTRAGRLPEAAAQFSAALALKPDQIEARYNLAMILLETGQARESIPEFAAVLRLKPDFAEAQGNLGNALRSVGRLPEALPHLQEAARLDPAGPQVRYNLGVALAGAGRLADAIREYQEALRLKPDYAAALDNLGVALAKSGRLPEALDCFGKAVRLKPDFAPARRNLGMALQSLGRAGEAQAQFEAAARLEAAVPPDHP